MVINAEDKRIIRMLTFLEKLGISGPDCALAEKYLDGGVGDEVLDQFQRIDFMAVQIPDEVLQELDAIEWDIGRGEGYPLWIRLFNVLFAIGHNTSSVLFSHSCVNGERYKAMVIYIEKCSEETGYLNNHHRTCFDMGGLMHEIDNKPEKVQEMIEQLKGEGAKYYLSVLAAYFYKKYIDAKLIAAEDTELMQVYEEGMLDCLDEWLAQQNCPTREKIVTAIHTQQLTAELLVGVKPCSFTDSDRKKLCFIGSMAYLNVMLSEMLLDIVRTCLAVDAEWILLAMSDAIDKSPGAKDRIGQDYSELFWIEPETYIRWAAFEIAYAYTVCRYHEEYVCSVQIPILKRQLEKNQESYLKALGEKGYTTLLAKKGYRLDEAISSINVLKDILQKENPALYEKIGAGKPNYEQIISYLVQNTPHAELAREYLRGHGTISELYPYEEEFSTAHIFYGYLENHKKHWKDIAFLHRCKTFLVLIGSDRTTIVEKRDKEQTKQVEQFFQILENENLDIAHQINGFVASYKAYNGPKGCTIKTFVKGATNVFARYLDSKRREETLAAFSNAKAEGRYLALLAMCKDIARNKQEILSYTSDNTKIVREVLLDILYKQRDWENDIKALLDAKKAAQRELAVQVLVHWQQEGSNYKDVLLHAMEKEKNAKIRSLIQSTLNIQESDLPQQTFSQDELIKQLHKGNKKKSLAWAYEKPFFPVHRIDGKEVSVEHLQAILLCYISQEENGISKNAQMLTKDLQPTELTFYMNELFDRWLVAGAESKRRWVLYATAIHGGEQMVQKLQHQIQEWPRAARGTLAAEAVRALALSPSPRALLLVDEIARKFKFKQVKAAAKEALEFAASELNITREELSDRIVPDLGFDTNIERVFNYGERKFTVKLSPTLDLEVYDENGKNLKNLPAPGKKDDETKAAAAYEDFKQLKKQIKTTISSQKAWLEYALSVRREWSVDAWKNLFVKNPLMHPFAIGLIWGIYDKEKLIQSFRYMEDGSFNTHDEKEYTMPEGAKISLVHPIELSDEEKATWKEQLVDYEITQPIEQIDRKVYYVTEEERKQKSMERFGGCIVNDLSLNGKLTGFGWYRGSVCDAGGFYTYYREDPEADMAVELHFSGTYIAGLDENVTIYDARFYKPGTIEHGSYTYDEVDKDKAYFLNDIPPRYFSEILLQIAQTVALSKEYNFNWKKEITTL
ncbi:MAG: DUF4132 domain-containing protein [Lachnospiraceae bacterium]|nr:DUF4132 domain-containing protein [Lachnospiraceae bacterium]